MVCNHLTESGVFRQEQIVFFVSIMSFFGLFGNFTHRTQSGPGQTI